MRSFDYRCEVGRVANGFFRCREHDLRYCPDEFLRPPDNFREILVFPSADEAPSRQLDRIPSGIINVLGAC